MRSYFIQVTPTFARSVSRISDIFEQRVARLQIYAKNRLLEQLRVLQLSTSGNHKITSPNLRKERKTASTKLGLLQLYAQRRERTEELLRSTFLDMFGEIEQSQC